LKNQQLRNNSGEKMKTQNSNKVEYGNWVSKKFIYGPGLIGLVFLGLAFLSLWWLFPAALFLMVATYFVYARYLFSPQGGDIQKQIRDLVLANLDWDGNGQALDIGCGNGALSIQLARRYPAAGVTGIDYWGSNWEYSQAVCERNAKVEGVGGRAIFQKASASALPFGDQTFDVVVSNLVFHEVNDIADKREVVREALRVVKKGGKFAFQDLFLLKQIYGEPQELLKTIQGWGIEKVEFVETRQAGFIPAALKLPFMVGTLGLVVGKK
jgi:ubiquinone/menaquinone biosynthesis C-methylase UbiE